MSLDSYLSSYLQREQEFQSWYAPRAAAWGLDPDPDNPRHFYDYRAAHAAGAEPGPDGHWPSEYKLPGHPNQFVQIDGVLTDTITMQPVSPLDKYLKSYQSKLDAITQRNQAQAAYETGPPAPAPGGLWNQFKAGAAEAGGNLIFGVPEAILRTGAASYDPNRDWSGFAPIASALQSAADPLTEQRQMAQQGAQQIAPAPQGLAEDVARAVPGTVAQYAPFAIPGVGPALGAASVMVPQYAQGLNEALDNGVPASTAVPVESLSSAIQGGIEIISGPEAATLRRAGKAGFLQLVKRVAGGALGEGNENVWQTATDYAAKAAEGQFDGRDPVEVAQEFLGRAWNEFKVGTVLGVPMVGGVETARHFSAPAAQSEPVRVSGNGQIDLDPATEAWIRGIPEGDTTEQAPAPEFEGDTRYKTSRAKNPPKGAGPINLDPNVPGWGPAPTAQETAGAAPIVPPAPAMSAPEIAPQEPAQSVLEQETAQESVQPDGPGYWMTTKLADGTTSQKWISTAKPTESESPSLIRPATAKESPPPPQSVTERATGEGGGVVPQEKNFPGIEGKQGGPYKIGGGNLSQQERVEFATDRISSLDEQIKALRGSKAESLGGTSWGLKNAKSQRSQRIRDLLLQREAWSNYLSTADNPGGVVRPKLPHPKRSATPSVDSADAIQAYEDVIRTKRAKGEAVPQEWLNKLAALRGNQESLSPGEIAGSPVFGHPQATPIMPDVYGNLIPIKVSSVDAVDRRIERTQKHIDSLQSRLVKRKGVKPLTNEEQTILEFLRDETFPELQRLRKQFSAAAPVPETGTDVPGEKTYEEIRDEIGRLEYRVSKDGGSISDDEFSRIAVQIKQLRSEQERRFGDRLAEDRAALERSGRAATSAAYAGENTTTEEDEPVLSAPGSVVRDVSSLTPDEIGTIRAVWDDEVGRWKAEIVPDPTAPDDAIPVSGLDMKPYKGGSSVGAGRLMQKRAAKLLAQAPAPAPAVPEKVDEPANNKMYFAELAIEEAERELARALKSKGSTPRSIARKRKALAAAHTYLKRLKVEAAGGISVNEAAARASAAVRKGNRTKEENAYVPVAVIKARDEALAKAADAGSQAFREGKSESDSPYKDYTEEHEVWLEQYRVAKSDAEFESFDKATKMESSESDWDDEKFNREASPEESDVLGVVHKNSVADRIWKLFAGGKNATPDEIAVGREEVEERIRAAHSLPREPFVRRMLGALNSLRFKYSRRFPELDPKVKQHAFFTDIARRFDARNEAARFAALEHIYDVSRGLNADKYKLAERIFLLRDVERGLRTTKPDGTPLYEGGTKDSFGFKDSEEVKAELDRLNKLADKPEYKGVKEAVERRDKAARKLVKRLVDADLLGSENLADPSAYFHRQVLLKYLENQAAKTGGMKLTKKGFQMRRKGGGDFNTNFAEAEFEWITHAHSQLAKKWALEQIERLDVLPKARREAKRVNFETLVGGPEVVTKIMDLRAERSAINEQEEKDSGDKKRLHEISEELNAIDPTEPFRREFAIGLSMALGKKKGQSVDEAIFEADSELSDQDGGIFAILQDLIDSARKLEKDALTDKSIDPAWVAAAQKQAAGAAKAFKAIADKNKMIRETLGSKFKTPINMMPEGYDRWQPDPGTQLAYGLTIEEQVVDKILSGIVELAPEDVKKQLVAVGPKKTLFLPKEIVSVLRREFGRTDIAPDTAKVMQKAVGLWKQSILFGPERAPKYYFRNLFSDTDAAMAVEPKIFKYLRKSWKRSHSYHFGESPSNQLRNRVLSELRLGIQDAGHSVQEVADIHDMWILPRAVKNTEPIAKRVGKSVVGFAKRVNVAREASFRSAAMEAFLDKVEQGRKTGKRVYGASNKDAINALYDMGEPDAVIAAKLARESMVDYAAISAGGRELRSGAIPFYAWMEGNLARYYNLLRNAPLEGKSVTGAAAKVALSVGGKTAGVMARATVLYAAGQLFNKLFWPDEDEEINRQRNEFQIILYADKDYIYTLPLSGALSDVLSWVALEDVAGTVTDVLTGKEKLSDAAANIAKRPLEKLVQSTNPFVKTAYELWAGESVYPNVFEQGASLKPQGRQIVDKPAHAAGMVGLKRTFEAATNRPTRDGSGPIAHLFEGAAPWFRSDRGENAYFQARQMAFKFKGDGGGDYDRNEKQLALYFYKKSQRVGDKENASYWLKKYKDAGGNEKGMETSIRMSSPWAGMAEKDHGKFFQSLTPKERETFSRALRWYKETYGLDHPGHF